MPLKPPPVYIPANIEIQGSLQASPISKPNHAQSVQLKMTPPQHRPIAGARPALRPGFVPESAEEDENHCLGCC